MLRASVALFGLILLSVNPASAQTGTVPQYPRFEVSAGLGVMSRGPGEASERALTSMDFHESYGGPSMTRPHLDGLFKMEIGVTRHRSIGFLSTRGVDSTRGVRDVPGKPHESLSVRHVVRTRAIVWSYRPNGWLSVGAGPAIHRRRFTIDPPDHAAVGVRSDRSLGAVAGVNVKTRRRDGLFVHALLQYRYAGSLQSDSVPVPLGSRRVVPRENVTWPSTKIPFSHRLMAMGIGFEL